MLLKRPTQAQVQAQDAKTAAVEAPKASVTVKEQGKARKAHPLVAAYEKADGASLSVERIVEVMNGSPWDRDAALLAISKLEAQGFSGNPAADIARGDGTAILTKEEGGKQTRVKLKQYGERTGCFMDVYGAQKGGQFRVKVRQYMTKPTEPGSSFDFQAKYNNNIPMPMRVMVGEVLEETRGMYKMRLHGRPEPSDYCLHCGRVLNHPVSVLYGIGPKCGEHYHINPLGSEEALREVMEEIKQKLAAVTWEGWIIKSAIESWDEITEESLERQRAETRRIMGRE